MRYPSVFDQPLQPAALCHVVLERIKIRCQQAVSLELLESCLSLNGVFDALADSFVMQLRVYLTAGEQVETVDIEERWPADWREAFLERWAPRWWLARGPVRYRTISVHKRIHTRLCPHLPSDALSTHVTFLMHNRGPCA